MFTGLIEEVGQIVGKQPNQNGITFKVNCQNITDDIKIDDSVAVNGVCLTVTNCSREWIEATAVQETLKKSTLEGLGVHARVNLERALTLNSRLGGHIVQGHVDGKGYIDSVRKESPGYLLSISLPEQLMKYTIAKGSIAVNGISLTIAEKYNQSIDLAIIPHTWNHTTLKELTSHEAVNIEVDLMAKYVENFMAKEPVNKITVDKLKELGY